MSVPDVSEIPLLEGKVSLNRDAYHRIKNLVWYTGTSALVFNLTLGENLSLGLDYASEEMEMTLQAVGLAKFANPESLAGVLQTTKFLSGGELKRLRLHGASSSKAYFASG